MSASEPVPSSREFTFVGIAYGLHVTGLFLVWPALIGLVLDYIKRGDVEGTVLESHYGWLIRTSWWSLLWGSLILGAMLAVIIPGGGAGRRPRAQRQLPVDPVVVHRGRRAAAASASPSSGSGRPTGTRGASCGCPTAGRCRRRRARRRTPAAGRVDVNVNVT